MGSKRRTKEEIILDQISFDPYLIHAIFKQVWSRRVLESVVKEGDDATELEAGVGTSKKNRLAEAAEHAATIAGVR